jgi:two-component system cell cycle sensor histidine kinase/response regulator CckA
VNIENSSNPIFDDQGNIIGFLAIQRDITERKQLETQLFQAQKMEAVGQLAGGGRPRLQQPADRDIGFGELALESLAERDPNRKNLEEVLRAADRAASLTRQQTLQPSVLNLNEVVANVDKMLRRLIGEHIELMAVLAPDLGRVKADAGQIEHVIMNLVVNARDAMPQCGKITRETANVELDGAYVRKHPVAAPGLYVMLAVTDTGCGMDTETQGKIFDPFFTTKEKRKGTGLGLSTVYGIVKQSGGCVSVYSELGRGTTFKVYLPGCRRSLLPSNPPQPRRCRLRERRRFWWLKTRNQSAGWSAQCLNPAVTSCS